MIPELGHFALALSLCVAVVLGIVPLLGAGLSVKPVPASSDRAILSLGITTTVIRWLRQNLNISTKQYPFAMHVARPAAATLFVLLSISMGCLAYSFYVDDFTVQYVAFNSNVNLPWPYKIAATWGSHEGSLLFWCFVLSIWVGCVALFSKNLPIVLRSRVLAILGLASAGFISFTLFTSNPFDRTFLYAADFAGFDLNPLLQHPGQAIHPPLLYIGYVGFAVPFAFAIAALIGGKLDALWIRWVRPWALVTWLFLTLGITLGSWWAYHELGWGGWWFWDPVENASFMPWLAGTALIHSLAATEKRGVFKSWSVLLAILCFAFSILGTLLVRSGLIESVHAFASDPERGIYLFVFFLIVVIGSLILFALRANVVASDGAYAGWSRELMLLINNVLLTILTIMVVLVGTIGPMVEKELTEDNISIGPEFFDTGFMWIGLPLLLVMGIGSLSRWKRDNFKALAPKLLLILPSIILGTGMLWLILGSITLMAAVGASLAFWVVITALVDPVKRIRKRRRVPLHVLGMAVAHIGMGVFVLGVVAVNGFTVESRILTNVGGVIDLGEYRFTFADLTEVKANVTKPNDKTANSETIRNYSSKVATINIDQNGERIATLYPEKRFYFARRSSTPESDVKYTILRDLFVSIDASEGKWIFMASHRPLMRWVWLGAVLMALGGLLAACDKRYRIKRQEVKQASRDIQSILADVKS